jgi:hypothetical protein
VKNDASFDNALYYDSSVLTNDLYLGRDSSSVNIRAGGAGNTFLTVKSTGNVGIGTTTPTMKLDVNGPVVFRGTSSQLRLYETDATNPLFAWHFSLNSENLTTYYGDDSTA